MPQSPAVDSFAQASAQEAGPPIGQLILRRKWLLVFGTLLGVGLGYLYFTQQPAVYRSYAWIQVSPNQMQLPTERFEQQAMIMALATQCDTIKSSTVVSAAVENWNLADRPEYHPDLAGAEARAISAINNGLTVHPKSEDSQTIVVDYLGGDPDETKAVVDAVVGAYREYIGDSDTSKTKDLVDLVTRAQDELLKDLAALEQKHSAFLEREGTTLLSQGEEWINPFAQRLLEIEQKRTEVMLQRGELESRIAVITQVLQNGGSREALSLMIDQLSDAEQKSEAAALAEQLFPLLLERELLSQSLGQDHPKIQSLNSQIALTQAHLNKVFDLQGRARGPRDMLAIYIQSIRYKIKTTVTRERTLSESYREVNRQAETLESKLSELREIEETIRRKDQVLAAIVRQLEEMQLFSTRGVVTEVITPAEFGQQTPEARAKFMGIGGVLGLLIFSVMAYMLEVNDKSFRSPEDIRAELGVSVVGHVPVIPSKPAIAGSSASPALCTLHSPRGQSSEAFRLIRTSLFFGARNGKMRVIQVTSPDQGDGKSTVAANLAVAVAQSGRRTLLVDADMRRPTVHRIFGLSNEDGIADVLGSHVDPHEVLRETETPNLSIMLCGPHPHNPAELLASHRFLEFLDWARDNYDFLILDTPPLLAVSDPGNVASRVDGVLLALRLGKRARAKGAEACEVLERVGANMLGVIINGVNARGEYGYNSGYRYTSASPSQYGYTETYYTREASASRNGNGHNGASRTAGRLGEDTSKHMAGRL